MHYLVLTVQFRKSVLLFQFHRRENWGHLPGSGQGGQGGKALYAEATPARVNSQRYKGVWPGQEPQERWYCWSEAVRWGDGALPWTRMPERAKEYEPFCRWGKLSKSFKLGCAMVRLAFNQDHPGAGVMLHFWGRQKLHDGAGGGREGERSGVVEDHLGICRYNPSEILKTN